MMSPGFEASLAWVFLGGGREPVKRACHHAKIMTRCCADTTRLAPRPASPADQPARIPLGCAGSGSPAAPLRSDDLMAGAWQRCLPPGSGWPWTLADAYALSPRPLHAATRPGFDGDRCRDPHNPTGPSTATTLMQNGSKCHPSSRFNLSPLDPLAHGILP